MNRRIAALIAGLCASVIVATGGRERSAAVAQALPTPTASPVASPTAPSTRCRYYVVAFGYLPRGTITYSPVPGSVMVNVPCGNLPLPTMPAPTVFSSPMPLPPAATPPPGSTIVFFGDSITGYMGACGNETNRANCYSAIVAAHFGATEINKGIGGSLLENPSAAISGISRYQTDVIPYCSPSSYLVLEFGTNDVAYSFLLPPLTPALTASTFASNIDTIISACNSAGMPYSHMTLVEPTYINDVPYFAYFTAATVPGFPSASEALYDGKLRAFGAAEAAEAQARGTLFAPTYDAMVQGGGNSLVSPIDGVHLTDAGYALLATLVENANYVQAGVQSYNAGIESALRGGGYTPPMIGGMSLAGSSLIFGVNAPVQLTPGSGSLAPSIQTSVGVPTPIPSPGPTSNPVWSFSSNGNVYFNAGGGSATWSLASQAVTPAPTPTHT